MTDFQLKMLCHGFAQGADAVTLRRMVSRADKRNACFIGKVKLGFRDFSGQISIDAFVYGRLKKSLRTAGTPCNAFDFARHIADGYGLPPQRCSNVLQPFSQSLRRFQTTYIQQVLFAEPPFDFPTQLIGKLRVVAQHWVCIQRQVVARHIDLVLQ